MPDDNKIKNYSASDIEKYHNGLLSARERHELEKAALDDPFLADALEGYATQGVNISKDIAELNKRLSGKIESSKVIPISSQQHPSFTWWRVAAVVILIAGAGFLIYQFAFNKKSNEIAENKPASQKESIATDSTQSSLIQKTEEKKETFNNNAAKKSEEKLTITNETMRSGIRSVKTDSALIQSPDNTPENIPASKGLTVKDNKKKKEINATDATIAKVNPGISNDKINTDEKTIPKVLSEKDAYDATSISNKNNNAALSKTNPVSEYKNDNSSFHTNVFHGRVTDINNNPLPFANITNTEDTIGTYADANGYFTLTFPDSVLKVRVQSLGFAKAFTQLHSDISINKITLQEDKNINAVVLSRKKANTGLFEKSTLKLEQPEPVDGWENYDTYLVNNLEIPETIRMKESPGKVEVSFEVDENGEPVNIKVEKSLCKECDKEAIRLIKDGPKWKNHSKKNKAKVTITF